MCAFRSQVQWSPRKPKSLMLILPSPLKSQRGLKLASPTLDCQVGTNIKKSFMLTMPSWFKSQGEYVHAYVVLVAETLKAEAITANITIEVAIFSFRSDILPSPYSLSK